MIVRIFAFVFFLLQLSFAAQAADPFTVTGVRVDATAANALEAQTEALSQGQTEAANILIRRMSLASDRAQQGFEGVSQSDGARMIRALEIANEKRSANRYLGDITVAFNKMAVAQYMEINGLQLIATQSRKRLLIPLLEGSASPADNEWTEAWEKRGYDNLLTPLVVINRPYLEQITAGSFSGSISNADLRSVARVFGVEQVLIARARDSLSGYRVSITDIALDGDTPRTLASTRGSTADEAVRGVTSVLEADWKAKTFNANTAQSVQLRISVLYRSHEEWLGLQDVINGSQQIRSAQLLALSNKGAVMSLNYGGDFERLQGELAFKGVNIRDDDELGIILFKSNAF